jgi:lysozyme
MNVSDKGIALIKEFEGCKLTAYQDSVGLWTIGYGHIEGVKQGDVITQKMADVMLLIDLRRKVQGVNDLVHADVTQSQFDALVSFSFNLGTGALAGSTLLKMINAGSADAAADQFLRWDHAGGVKVAGLTRRRKAEQQLYIGATA